MSKMDKNLPEGVSKYRFRLQTGVKIQNNLVKIKNIISQLFNALSTVEISPFFMKLCLVEVWFKTAPKLPPEKIPIY